MGWDVARVGSSIHVTIALPIGDWEALYDDVRAHLEPRPSAITLPRELPDATKTDAEMLQMLWMVLGSQGIPLLPPSD
jgi:hypothetical protein